MIIPAYTIEPSSRCSTMSLYVQQSGEVHVKVPTNYDPAEVRQYVIESAGWIERTQRILFARHNPAAQYSVMIGDQPVQYTITYQGTRKNISIFCHHDGRIEVRVPWNATVKSVMAVVEQKKDRIREMRGGGGNAREPTSKSGYEHSFGHDGKVVPYSVKFSSRARRITIHVKPDRSVEVTAPVRKNREEIHRLIVNKSAWIYAQVTTNKRAIAVRRSFCDGETYPFLGGTLTVRVTRGESKAYSERKGLFIDVHLPLGTLPAIEHDAIKSAVEYHVKRETLEAAIPRVIHYAAAFGVMIPEVKVRKNKGKWGFCTSKKTITFASELCMLIPRLFDYVVAHEVCHLIVMDHSDRFWNTFRTVMPDCRDRQVELKRDSPLYRIFWD